ncbi:MAG: radical SAM protein [Kiritimatiellia bacterium]
MTEVYSDAKILYFHAKLHDLKRGRISAPLHVRLKPTNRCNQRCSYCCYRNPQLPLSEELREQDEIPREKMREIIRDLVAMGVRAVTFSGGGEPLCYPHITEALDELTDSGVKVGLLTNGTVLQGAIAELLARRATWLRVSMDAANPTLYSRTRHCTPHQFELVCQNIRDFAQLEDRTCTLGLNLVVTRENSGEVLSFLRLARSLGADHVKVAPVVVSRTAEANAEYLAPVFYDVKAQIAAARKEMEGSRMMIVDKFHWPTDSSPESYRPSYSWCPFAQCLTVIGADQNVYTCQDKAYSRTGCLGSLRNQSFRSLWFSEATRKRLLELNPRVECQHHCVASRKNRLLLDFFQVHPQHLEFV